VEDICLEKKASATKEKAMSQIIGIGVDIEKISRFEVFETNKEHAFLKRAFTNDELDYCFSQARPSQHLAARYAGKEAVVKALSTQVRILYNQIEILNDKKGRPMVTLEIDHGLDIKISLSHSGDMAIAFVILWLLKAAQSDLKGRGKV
jgi:holo-[acyl-carrier protein] synthase